VRHCSFAPFRLVTARRAAALLATTAALGLAACGDDDDDDGGVGPGGIGGTYTLRSLTMGGTTDNSAPFTLAEGEIEGVAFLLEIKSASVTLSNGRYTATSDTRTVIAGEVDESDPPADAGAYTVSGSTITFNPDDAEDENFSAAIAGNSLTATETGDLDEDPSTPDETVVFVYSK
jgi:hypothetical protein